MDGKIKKLYTEAPRFDEGELYQSEAYRETVRRRLEIYDRLVLEYGNNILSMLDSYTEAVYGEMELEARHFFAEGYKAGKADAGKKSPTQA